jgi:transposase
MDAPSFPELLHEVERLRAENARLQETIRDLQRRLEEAERAGKRQAAPFSQGPPKRKPKRPGRKRGNKHGRHGHRPPPSEAQVDETHEAPLPGCCPDCGGPVVEDRVDAQFQTEIPRRPVVRKFTIHCGHCRQCGRPVRGRHPLQTSAATGAAASQLGPDAQAAIVYLNKRAGMSHGKIADTFATMFGIRVTRGACAQIVLRAGRKLRPVYRQITEKVQDSGYLTPDETGWRIGGRPAWLHAWVGDDGATLYAIDPRRSAEVLEGVIGRGWSGCMTHDGFSSYDRFEDAVHQQCVDHALRRARGLLDKQSGAARRFPRQVIRLFRAALRRRDRLNEEDADEDRRGRAYERFVDRLRALTGRRRADPRNERFAKHLYRHAASWFVFLLDKSVPATNHRGEQALKTPIVNRKVWGGNRTPAGGQAQSITCSVLETCKNRRRHGFDFLSRALRGEPADLFDTPSPPNGTPPPAASARSIPEADRAVVVPSDDPTVALLKLPVTKVPVDRL